MSIQLTLSPSVSHNEIVLRSRRMNRRLAEAVSQAPTPPTLDGVALPSTDAGATPPTPLVVAPISGLDVPMTPKQIAAFLKVSPATIARRLRDPKFPRLRIAGQVRFVPRDVVHYFRVRNSE